MARRNAAGPVSGRAMVGHRTKDLIKRLKPGDIAFIDHEDLDRVAAEGLIEAEVGAIVNASKCISGRYPNVGPLLVAAASVPLIDGTGEQVMDLVAEGRTVRLEGGDVWLDGAVVAKGTRQSLQQLEAEYEQAKVSLGAELERFAENTLEFMQRERHLLLDAPNLPDVGIDFRGRQVLVVVRGADYRSDLAHLRSYVREVRPILIGVDGGADALREIGLKPDLIVGDFDSVSDDALRGDARLVVHAYADGRAPGAARLDELGVDYITLPFPGTSEDIAMLLAHENGAELIVAVGTHASMVEFLEKGRPGMASTFLVRLRVGPILVDAKGVSRLYNIRMRKRDFAFFLLAALFVVVLMVIVAYPLRVFFEGFRFLVGDWLESLFR